MHLTRRMPTEQPLCIVAMEACASAHHWAREMSRHGNEVRLIALHYVEPKRQKIDAADAEAIVEAALRPTMRFAEPKTVEQQAQALVFRTREQFVNQRTEAINVLRFHRTSSATSRPRGSAICRASKRSPKNRTRSCRGLAAASVASCWAGSPI